MSSLICPAKQIYNFIWCDMTSLQGLKYSTNFFKNVTSIAIKAPKWGYHLIGKAIGFFELYACGLRVP